MVQIAVFGYGTVGSGVVEVLEKNKDMITKKAGTEIEVCSGFERFSGRSHSGKGGSRCERYFGGSPDQYYL